MSSLAIFAAIRLAVCAVSSGHSDLQDDIADTKPPSPASSSPVAHQPEVPADALPQQDVEDAVVLSQEEAEAGPCSVYFKEEGMSKTVTMLAGIKRIPVLGAEQVLASIPVTHLCFFRRAPAPLHESQSWTLVKYNPPVLEDLKMRSVLSIITGVQSSGEQEAREERSQDVETSYGSEIFHALFYSPSFLYAVVDEFRVQAQETQGIVIPRSSVSISLVLLLATKVLACHPTQKTATSALILSSKSQLTAPSSPTSSSVSEPQGTSVSCPASYSPAPTSTSPVPSTPYKGPGKENACMLTPSATPTPMRERGRPRILMPFVNRLVEQQTSSNARIGLTGQAACNATSSSSPRSRSSGSPGTPATPSRPSRLPTPSRPSMLATPSPTPSPSPGTGKAANKEKHWRKRRAPRSKAKASADNTTCGAVTTPSKPKPKSDPLAQ